MLKHVRSWLYVGDESRPFVVLDGYQVYMGSTMIVRLLAGCHCTCALINWMVLLQLASGQDLTLLPYVYLKQKSFFLQNQFWQTYSYI